MVLSIGGDWELWMLGLRCSHCIYSNNRMDLLFPCPSSSWVMLRFILSLTFVTLCFFPVLKKRMHTYLSEEGKERQEELQTHTNTSFPLLN